MPKKSGQTALILVIVTMVTVLGIGVASSTQSNINLRNTVYSTQSEQALACAEAGAEKSIGLLTLEDPSGDGVVDLASGGPINSNNTDVDLGSCTYSYTVEEYPAGSGELIIPKLQENTVQELKFSPSGSVPSLNIVVTPLSTTSPKVAMAVYVYTTNATTPLVRSFYRIRSNDGNPSEFQDATSGTISLPIPNGARYIRLRPLYSDVSIRIPNYPNPTGFRIESTGNAGIVQRVVEVYRFNSQLPAAFDEAVVMLGQ